MRLFIILFILSSCASIESSVPFEMRTYDICQDLQGFCWQYQKCEKKIIGICLKKVIAVDKIQVEFKDKTMAKKLYDQDFVLRVRKKPL